MKLIRQLLDVGNFYFKNDQEIICLHKYENDRRNCIVDYRIVDFCEVWRFKGSSERLIMFNEKIYIWIYEGNYANGGTKVLNSNTGNVLVSDFEIQFHSDKGIFIEDDKYLYYSSYNGKSQYILFDFSVEDVIRSYPMPMGINGIKSLAGKNNDYFISSKYHQIHLHCCFDPNPLLEIDLRKHFDSRKKIEARNVKSHNQTIITVVFTWVDRKHYLVGIDMESGEIKWRHNTVPFYEYYKGKVYVLNKSGRLRIINPDSGVVEAEHDLGEEFKKYKIESWGKMVVTDTHFLGQSFLSKKMVIINYKTLRVEEVITIPDDHLISKSDYPIVRGDKIYLMNHYPRVLAIYELPDYFMKV